MKLKNITVQLTEIEAAKLKKLAKDNGRSRKAQAEWIIKEAIK
jgi:hypothetical protein